MENIHIVVLSLLVVFCAGQKGCPRDGPGGSYECIEIARYQGKQWGTCLTNTYIKTKSGGNHQCTDPSRKYCWYQCMIESFDQNSGPVNEQCACDGADLENKLPTECSSPDGTVCDWYSDCLEKKYPCENTDDSYAITYAQRYCQLYNKNYDWFSNQAKTWIDDVRKCLQVSLVPYIRDYSMATCAEVKQAAFDSHSPCYVNSGICKLSCVDVGKVFWTIKGAFVEEFKESLKGLFTVGGQCVQRDSGCFDDLGITWIYQFNMSLLPQERPVSKPKESSGCPQCTDDKTLLKLTLACAQCLAEKAMDKISKQLDWGKTTLDWIPFAKKSDVPGELVFDAYITDQALIQSTTSVDNTFLVESVNTLVNMLENGEIEVEADGWSITQFGRCTDVICDQPHNITNVTTTLEPTTPDRGMDDATRVITTTIKTSPGHGAQLLPQLFVTGFACLYACVVKFIHV